MSRLVDKGDTFFLADYDEKDVQIEPKAEVDSVEQVETVESMIDEDELIAKIDPMAEVEYVDYNKLAEEKEVKRENKEIERLSKALKERKGDISVLSNELAKVKSSNEELTIKATEVQFLRSSIDALNNVIDRRSKEIKRLEIENQKLSNENTYDAGYKDATEKAREVTNERLNLQQKRFENEEKEVEKEVCKLVEAATKNKDELDKIRKKDRKLESEYSMMSDKVQKYDALNNKYEEALNRIRMLESENSIKDSKLDGKDWNKEWKYLLEKYKKMEENNVEIVANMMLPKSKVDEEEISKELSWIYRKLEAKIREYKELMKSGTETI